MKRLSVSVIAVGLTLAAGLWTAGGSNPPPEGSYFVITPNVTMRRVSLFLPEELLQGLERLKQEPGTPQAESIRRAP